MKKLIALLLIASFSSFAQSGVNLKCTDGYYYFNLFNMTAESGMIQTAGNYGSLSEAELKLADEQPYQNYIVFTDKHERKISVEKTAFAQGASNVKHNVYFNDYKYTCTVR
jgi:hypothetical protein